MNKISLSAAVIALIASAFSFVYFQSSSELVYVDVNKLMSGYSRTAIEKEAFNKKAATLKANVDSLMMNWQNELKVYEKERNTMSKKELELKKELLGTRQQQINNYQDVVQRQLQEEDKKVTQTVINDINDFVKAYGKSHGHKMIFGAGGSGNIMYASDATDLTDKVLKGLNESYEGR